MKRWQVDKFWYVIQRCRRCDKWQRKTIDLAESGTPTLVNEKFIVHDPAITPEMKANYQLRVEERKREAQRWRTKGL